LPLYGWRWQLPFFPLHSFVGTDLAKVNPNIKFVENPYGEGRIAVVPPLNPDVTIVHAQRADANGNTQIWGILGYRKKLLLRPSELSLLLRNCG